MPPGKKVLRTWRAAEEAADGWLLNEGRTLRRVRADSESAGLPSIQVSPSQGKLLALIASAIGARRILEVGTLGAYSTIWLARALPADGRLVSLELSPRHAKVARANIRRAHVADRVRVVVGAASETLRGPECRALAPYDLVFLDADKPGYADYLEAVLPLCRNGAVLVADNVVREGRIAHRSERDPNVRGIRHFLERVGSDPRMDAVVIQTVGSKGHDGFLFGRVR